MAVLLIYLAINLFLAGYVMGETLQKPFMTRFLSVSLTFIAGLPVFIYSIIYYYVHRKRAK